MASLAQRRGQRAERWGRAAEEALEAHYQAIGGEIVARRARTAAGEIDLVVRLGGMLAFVEVKARKTMAAALSAVSPKDWVRRGAAAEAFAAASGHLGDMRLDLAAMDRNGAVQVIENASLQGAI